MSAFVPPGLSWQPQLPDLRDYTLHHDAVQQLLRSLKRRRSSTLPRTKVDLREFFPAVSHQQHLRWSPVLACVAAVEYFERRAHGRLTRRSVPFVYKASRKLLQRTGDAGVDLRTTWKAIARFGIPPAQYWPEDPSRFDEDPDPFLYALAGPLPLIYVRLDRPHLDGSQTLAAMKAFLSAGFPCIFGFSVPESISQEADIPWRPTFDAPLGGQVVVAVGYDDQRIRSTKGALLIRNSWGTQWGEEGYGFLPYRFVEQQLTGDCWTVLSASWLESGEFGQPLLDEIVEQRAERA